MCWFSPLHLVLGFHGSNLWVRHEVDIYETCQSPFFDNLGADVIQLYICLVQFLSGISKKKLKSFLVHFCTPPTSNVIFGAGKRIVNSSGGGVSYPFPQPKHRCLQIY